MNLVDPEQQSLLVLIAPARRRDDIVDALMGNGAISGFSVGHSAGFSREHGHLDRRERVQGHGDFARFEILCSAGARRSLLDDLAAVAGRDALRYWVLPLIDAGTIGG